MRFRIWVWVTLAVMLALVAGCAGMGRTPVASPTPIKTLRPTFTYTPAKPKPSATPQAAAAPSGQSAPAAVAKAATPTQPPASPTPAPASPTPIPPSPTPEKATFTVSSAGATNVRSGPGTTYTRIGEVRQGQTFEITGKNQAGTWWQFSFSGQSGWISGEMVSANAASASVSVAANIPAAPVQPTPRPVQAAPPPAQPTAAPPPPAAIFAQGGAEVRNADNTNFNVVTFWGRLPAPGNPAIGGGYRLKVSAPSNSGEVAFSDFWQDAYPGQGSAYFVYNAKFEAPRTGGSFRAVVVDGSGKEVSDAITGALLDRTHDVLLTWWKR